MLNRTHLRPIERRDVHALLDIIRDARAEHGLAARVENLLEPADLRLYDQYQARRTIYFVAIPSMARWSEAPALRRSQATTG